LHWWSLILKAFATDSIFGRDSWRDDYYWKAKERCKSGDAEREKT
jgi:hypothetical protein